MTDDLELRLRAADPSPAERAVDDARSPRARALMEHVMNSPEAPKTISLDARSPLPRRRRGLIIGAAAAVVIAMALGAALVSSGDDGRSSVTIAAPAPAGGPVMSSCIALSPDVLSAVDLAFDGTVTKVDGDQVILAVSRWFKGGTSDDVVVTQQAAGDAPSTIEMDGVVLNEGGHYLVSATGGVVNGCGFSGNHTEELLDLYEQAFPR